MEAKLKKNQLTSQLFIKDTPGSLDDNDVKSGQNNGLFSRASYFEESKTVDLEGPLYADVFNMNHYILNQVAIGVRLYRSKGEFCLITNESTPDFQVIIEDIVLRVCKSKSIPVSSMDTLKFYRKPQLCILLPEQKSR